MIEKGCLEKLGIDVSDALSEKLTSEFREIDQFMMRVLWLHWLVASTLMGYAYGFYLLGFIAGGVICALTYLSLKLLEGTIYPRVVIGVAFALFMSLFIQQNMGQVEMHFHFFMSLSILMRYKSLLPIIATVATASIHHLVWGYCQINGVEVFSTPLMMFDAGSGWGILALHFAFGLTTVFFLVLVVNEQTRQFCQQAMSSEGVADMLRTLIDSGDTRQRLSQDHEYAEVVNTVLNMMNKQVANSQALMKAHAALVIVDNENRIVFVNDRADTLLSGLCRDGAMDIPKTWQGCDLAPICLLGGIHFDGQSIEGTEEVAFTMGECHIQIISEPVVADNGQRLGVIVEWIDVSSQRFMQGQVKSIVQAAQLGDLSRRIQLSEKDDLLTPIAEVFNQLLSMYEKVIDDTMKVFTEMGKGNFSQSTCVGCYQGKFAQLQKDANNTVKKLVSVVDDIHQVSGSLAQESGELAKTNAGLAQRTEEQAASIEETAATLEQITASVTQSADHAQVVSQSAVKARERINQTQQVVSDTVSTMQTVSEASKKVLGITGLMNEIAFQTNLLSLNAAVEAARAGDHGRGFAVVAAEVRNLALRSSEAAKEIEQLITSSVNQVQQGSQSVHRSSEAMGEVIQSVSGVTELIEEIALAAQEQSNGIRQINQALSRLEATTQQNASMVSDTQRSSEEMARKSQQLNQIASFSR